MILYESDKFYSLVDYNQSHSKLLIRGNSKGKFKNIDIIFVGVNSINIPIDFIGISISQEIFGKFNIRTEGNCFSIEAHFLQVIENDLDFDESSIRIEQIKYEQLFPKQESGVRPQEPDDQ